MITSGLTERFTPSRFSVGILPPGVISRGGAFFTGDGPMYRTVDTALWTDPEVRELTPNEKLLFLYLITNQHTHLSGIYYLPLSLASHETGLSESAIRKGLDTLSIRYLAKYDPPGEVVWVVKMFRYQGHGEKSAAAAANQLKALHKCKLINEFLQFYADRNIPYRYPIDTQSGGDLQEQEKEQCKNQEKTKETGEGEGNNVAGDIIAVFDHYKTLHPRSHPKPSSTSKEWQRIRDRLGDGYSLPDLQAAIDGCHRTPHNQGVNDRGQKYLGLELIMRTADQVARFMEAPMPNGMSQKERQGQVAGEVWLQRMEDRDEGK